jgi:hypothetical protein
LLRQLHSLDQPNSIVLFKFDIPVEDSVKIREEPVYNVDAPWPDDEQMIRAHDFGPRNIQLFDYYARKDPTRTVSIFDRKTGAVQDLGPVGRLAHQRAD